MIESAVFLVIELIGLVLTGLFIVWRDRQNLKVIQEGATVKKQVSETETSAAKSASEIRRDDLITDLATDAAIAVAANIKLTARVDVLEEGNAGLRQANTNLTSEISALKLQMDRNEEAASAKIGGLNEQVSRLTAQLLELQNQLAVKSIETAGKDAQIERLEGAASAPVSQPAPDAGAISGKLVGDVTLSPEPTGDKPAKKQR